MNDKIRFFLMEYRDSLQNQKNDFLWTHSPSKKLTEKHRIELDSLTRKIKELTELLKNLQKSDGQET